MAEILRFMNSHFFLGTDIHTKLYTPKSHNKRNFFDINKFHVVYCRKERHAYRQKIRKTKKQKRKKDGQTEGQRESAKKD